MAKWRSKKKNGEIRSQARRRNKQREKRKAAKIGISAQAASKAARQRRKSS